METYKNDYTQEEDELLWELHEIRHRLSEKYSKMSVDEIAIKLGFSKQKVYRIIRKYKNNSIKDTSKRNDFEMKRYFFVLVKKTNKPMAYGLIEKNLIEKFKSNEYSELNIKINCCFSTNGISDLLFFISAKNILQTKEFCNLVSSSFSEYVSGIEVIELLSPIEKKQNFNFSLNNLSSFQNSPKGLKKPSFWNFK